MDTLIHTQEGKLVVSDPFLEIGNVFAWENERCVVTFESVRRTKALYDQSEDGKTRVYLHFVARGGYYQDRKIAFTRQDDKVV